MKRSCESDLASANGSVRRIRFGCSQTGSGFDVCDTACSRTIQNVLRWLFCARSASPSMRERRV